MGNFEENCFLATGGPRFTRICNSNVGGCHRVAPYLDCRRPIAMPSRLPIKPTTAAKMMTTISGATPLAPPPAATPTPPTKNPTIAPLNPPTIDQNTSGCAVPEFQQLRNLVPGHSNAAYRVLSESPRRNAFAAVAPGVRFSVFEIFLTPAFCFATVLSVFTSSRVHSRRTVFFVLAKATSLHSLSWPRSTTRGE